MNEYITVIGGGLAGTEAAYQIAKRGISVKLYEMKPTKFSPAHSNSNLAEIVCSNSFKSNLLTNACGLLKEELRRLDSLLIKIADETKVPAGQALAVDREEFSKKITKKIYENPLIEVINEEIGENLHLEDLAKNGIVIVATGPLTEKKLSQEIAQITGQDKLHFYDAAAPIVTKESIDFNIAFYGNRYEQEKKKDETLEEWEERLKKQDASYINLPMNKEEYEEFYTQLINAEVATLHNFEKKEIFEGCMPVEVMAKRGIDTLRYGPLKPVGFDDPRTASIYNLVGFQTNLKFGEQKRVFSMIPGLKNAEFVKYGVMHRNTYINSTVLLDETYNLKKNNNIYFAGQLTGVEGYVESISSGLVSAINAVERLNSQKEKRKICPIIFSKYTMIGALAKYISTENKKFQPMNANFGILPELEEKIKDKKLKYQKLADRALKF
jgi:methylenetetrahydrofolate--tRNA-(uracil-5-)-methyltransferase